MLEEEERIAHLGYYTERVMREDAAADAEFRVKLLEKGLRVVDVAPDGNCLFRAAALHVYGDQSLHREVRTAVCDYMLENQDRFQMVVSSEKEFAAYVETMRQLSQWGDDPEVRAIEELYDREVEIYTATGGAPGRDVTVPIKLNFDDDLPPALDPKTRLRLSYHGGNHYNAVLPVGKDPVRTSKTPEINPHTIRAWRLRFTEDQKPAPTPTQLRDAEAV